MVSLPTVKSHFFLGVKYEQEVSAEEQRYLKLLQSLLKCSGAHVPKTDLTNMLKEVTKYNPWFTQTGTKEINIQIISLDMFSTWYLVRSVLKSSQSAGSDSDTEGRAPC